MSLYRDTSIELGKEIQTKEFYRFEGAKTCSKLNSSNQNDSGYIYISKSQDHHMYFTMRRLKQALNALYIEETGESLTNGSIRSNETYPVIRDLVLYGSSISPLYSYRLITPSSFERLIKENCIRNDQPKNGKKYVERVDKRVYGGGYGLADEWKNLLLYITFFTAQTRISKNDLYDLIIKMRQTGKLTSKDHLQDIIANHDRYTYEVNPYLESDFNKYNIANALEEIEEKGLVLPTSSLAETPRKVVREVMDEYERGREKTLELIGKRYEKFRGNIHG